MKMHKQIEAGFTITELIVVIVAFAILLPAIASTISLLDSINDRARDTATVNALVENKTESLRSTSFTGVALGTTDFTDELPDGIAAPRSATYNVTEVSPSLKQIDINVNYSNHGDVRTMSYRTYIGELGVGQY